MKKTNQAFFYPVVILLSLFFTTVCVQQVKAEILVSDQWGYALDLPEGFSLTQKAETGDSYLFEHTILPVQVVVRLYPLSRYDNAQNALDGSFKSLNATGDSSVVEWRNTDCVIGNFGMTLNGKGYEGWAVSAKLPEEKGILLVMAYTGKQYASDSEQFILSIIDSVNIDRGSFYTAGPVTTFAFPAEGDITQNVEIAGVSIPVILDKSDSIANQFVVDREYAVLTLYAQSDMWKEAWKRYYRLVYRDAYNRLKRTAFSIYGSIYPEAYKAYPTNPNLGLVQLLLTWTQGFEYDRNPTGSDFTALPAIFDGKGSDCDSRALLLAVLNDHIGIETAIFVSQVYSHAMFGAVVDAPGAKIEIHGKKYVMGETTAPVNMGLISSDMNNTDNWIPVLSY